MLPNERQLVERAARRDEKAFATLYSVYFDKIYEYIYYRSLRKDEAEDLTSHVFLKAWEAIENYRWQGYPFSTWLYRIAHNQIVDHYRTHRECLPLDVAEKRDSGHDPMDIAIRASAVSQIRGALKHLTKDQARVLTLRYFEGYSVSEIAQMMGKAPDAVRALQHRALRVLQPRLHADGQFTPKAARTPGYSSRTSASA
jgi:RNA polymerase sigma-70 factor (ECF subfamily)